MTADSPSSARSLFSQVERRLVGQIVAACTSVGANLFEADQAVSRADFCRCVGIAVKELSETRFWIRLIGRQGWLEPQRLAPLETECLELQRILNAMIRNTRLADKKGTERGSDSAQTAS